MNETEIKNIVSAILINQYNISPDLFDWDKVLEELSKNFIWLGVLEDLEKKINNRFSKTIPVIENIDSSIHTPKDIVLLIAANIHLP